MDSERTRNLKFVVQAALCVVFLVFGVDLLIGSYSLEQVPYFILTFFASNLIILISLALLAGAAVRRFRKTEPTPEPPSEEQQSPENSDPTCRE